MKKSEIIGLKIGLYSPYLHITGGGERYILSIASHLSKKNKVTIFGEYRISKKIKELLDLDLSLVRFVDQKEMQNKNFIQKLFYLKNFDIFFFVTDGSIFFNTARKKFLIIQSPSHIPALSIVNNLKLSGWITLCYSRFMHSIIKTRLGTDTIILPPPVDTKAFHTTIEKKENSILAVGRFFLGLHHKNHKFLVNVFIKQYEKLFKGWELHLAGGFSEESGKELISQLNKQIVGFPIHIHVNIKFDDLVNLYKKAKIFWHATGYGVDENIYPEKTEHFGITTVEAMAARAVPIVYKSGGQLDIVQHKISGFFWKTENELILHTQEIMENKRAFEIISSQAQIQAENFSLNAFYEKLDTLIEG